jgi:putative phage abortive infection protein
MEAPEKRFCRIDNPVLWGIVASLVILVIMVYLGYSKNCDFSTMGPPFCRSKLTIFLDASPNEIGDTLAGFAGAWAFIWIVVTVMLQSQELREQRKELKNQWREYKKMNQAMATQTFENTFFEMLSTLSRIVSQLRSKVHRNVTDKPEGKEVFGILAAEFTSLYKGETNLGLQPEGRVSQAYDLFWNKHRPELSHYFRYLFNFFRLLSEADSAKPYHAKILRSQISDEELILLFYNCLASSGKKMEKYAIEFELFDNMDPTDLIDRSHARLINPTVFGPDKRGMLKSENLL